MKPRTINFVVGQHLRLGDAAVVDAEGVIFADRAASNRVNVKRCWGWQLGTLPARYAQTVFVEEGSACRLISEMHADVAVCGAWRDVGSVGNQIGNVTEFLSDKNPTFVVGDQRDVLSEVCSCYVHNPKETHSGECFDKADDFYGEIAA